jgi:hypothetical protein
MLGGFAAGMAQALQAGRQNKIDKEERDLKKQTLKLQMENAKIQQQQQKFKNTLLERFMPTLEGGAAPGGEVSAGGGVEAQSGPGLLDQLASAQSPMSPSPAEVAANKPAQMGPGTSLLDRLSEMDQNQLALLSEATGIDFLGGARYGEQKRSNDMRESEYVGEEVTRPDGSKERVYRPKYGKPPALSGATGGQPATPTAPAPVESYTFEKNGITYEGIREKQTGKDVVEPKPIKQIKGESSETASKIALAKNAIDYTDQLQTAFISPKGINQELILKANAPMGGIGEGRKLRAMFNDALDARARAATGAAMPESEIRTYTRMYFPSPLDNEATVKDKLTRLKSFMTDYLDVMDPNGAVRANLAQKQGGEAAQQPKATIPPDGTTGTYEGRKVMVKNGEWTYAD